MQVYDNETILRCIEISGRSLTKPVTLANGKQIPLKDYLKSCSTACLSLSIDTFNRIADDCEDPDKLADAIIRTENELHFCDNFKVQGEYVYSNIVEARKQLNAVRERLLNKLGGGKK